MLHSRLEGDEKAFARLSHAIRTQTSEDAWLAIDSANLDHLLHSKLPPVTTQTKNLMTWLASAAGDDALAPVDMPDELELAGVVGVVDGGRVDDLIRFLERDGFVEYVPENCLQITPKGWRLLDDSKASDTPSNAKPPHENSVPLRSELSDCHVCGPQKHSDVLAEHQSDGDQNDGTFEYTKFRMLRCGGCRSIRFRKDVFFSENVEHQQNPKTGEWDMVLVPTTTYWPTSRRRKKPVWVSQVQDGVIHRLFEEIYSAIDADLFSLAAMGIRALLDKTFDLAGADPAKNFSQKLVSLQDAGKIGREEREILTVMTDAGSAASHRGWRPDNEALETILDATESVLHRIAVLKSQATELKGRVPPRPKS